VTGHLRVIVLGYVVRGPLGGLAWHHLQYVLGLARLGHDVLFIEDSDDYPSCYDPIRGVTDVEPSYGLAFAARAFGRLGLGAQWAYHDAHTASWLGPAATRAPEACASADVVLNVSGVNPLRPWWAAAPVRVFIDTDPAFTQIRHLHDERALDRAREHTAFFTFGENVGSSRRVGSTIGEAPADCPSDGLPWQPTHQPIVLDAWPITRGPANGAFTTVMQWDSYQVREHGGRTYGMKSLSFESYVDLPARVDARLEIALGSPTAPRAELIDRGWAVRDPLEVTRDPWTYQAYIQRSKGEFSVAKHGYVVSRSGWFSERSACYLASGRPVVVQDTGFSNWLPTGSGILAFETPDGAVAAIEAVTADYARHCRAARDIAETYFDSDAVLTELLDRSVATVAS
jgi:hypothetical protein